MGVSGSGKSTLARRLAQALNGSFIEGDDHHAEDSRDKMRRGIALCDSDREPWLDRLSACMRANADTTVLSCSALKRSYRARLRAGVDELKFVFLDISLSEAIERVSQRRGHEFPTSLVADQFAALESPAGEGRVLCLSAGQAVGRNVAAAARWIRSEMEHSVSIE
ncbi:gluconate kinase (SKI family) [Trinickia symbiotica]|uniref:Gluconokinase n=1 Tax=Trinickia symbiotica TaxID=863227 RepID=A0A2N7WV26_9BURK|nr:gluconokinase [Trinickia symbiotica]PMS33323.1 gluconokinase [Trinickia symbiotica]PPK42297.1 gluconate kinase (SKI family) [Trinickia symbiotica]